MKEYKYIFWDNDGVLVDTEKLYLKSNVESLRGLGIELTLEDFQEINLKQGRSVFDLIPQDDFSPEDRKALALSRNDLYSSYLSSGVSYLPDVQNVLEKLNGKIPMAIVTSSLKHHFDLIHQNNDLSYFDFILTRGDYKKSKPYPEPYLLAAEKAGVNPVDCLVIEDSARGLAAAKAAGMDCFVIPHEISQNADWSQADFILDSIELLLRELDL